MVRSKEFGCNSIILILCALALMILCNDASAAPLPFGPAQEIGKARDPKLTDLDSDGDLDIVAIKNVAAIGTEYSPFWYENKGTTWTGHLIIDWQSLLMAIEPADIDRDGDMDLIIASTGIFVYTTGLTQVAWLENNGAQPPHFIPHSLFNSPADYVKRGVCVADMDNDGDLEVVANFSSQSSFDKGLMLWYENDGSRPPQFTSHTLAADIFAPMIGVLTAADIDGDGWQDVVMGTSYDGTWWFKNSKSKTLPFTGYTITGYRGKIRTADLNGEGMMDVLIGYSWLENRGGMPTTFTVHLLTPDFKPGDFQDYGEVAVGDLDRDGHPDAVTYNPKGGVPYGYDLHAFQNNGQTSPTFTMSKIGADHVSSAIGDVNGDGNPDVVVVHVDNPNTKYEYRQVRWYRNQLARQPVTVLAPNDAGRVFASGGPMTVHWRTDVAVAGKRVVLELWRGTKTKITWLANSSNEQGRGSVTFTVPSVPTGSNYRIRALSGDNHALVDFSDEPFIIQNTSSGVPEKDWAGYR